MSMLSLCVYYDLYVYNIENLPKSIKIAIVGSKLCQKIQFLQNFQKQEFCPSGKLLSNPVSLTATLS